MTLYAGGGKSGGRQKGVRLQREKESALGGNGYHTASRVGSCESETEAGPNGVEPQFGEEPFPKICLRANRLCARLGWNPASNPEVGGRNLGRKFEI